MTERRYSPVELRFDGNIVTARIANFGVKSKPIGGEFIEMLGLNAFTPALQSGSDVPALIDHDETQEIGNTRDRSLSLAEDSAGLLARIELPETTLGRSILRWLQRSQITGCSYGMLGIQDAWQRDNSGIMLRSIRSIGVLSEISLLHGREPAYPATAAQLGVSRDWQAAERVRKSLASDFARIPMPLSLQDDLDRLNIKRLALSPA